MMFNFNKNDKKMYHYTFFAMYQYMFIATIDNLGIYSDSIF